MDQNLIIIATVVIFMASLHLHVEAATSTRRCGLPPFVDDLPDADKQKVLAVWRNYKSGEDCTFQRYETQEIIHNLPSEVRAVVFGRPPAFLKDASFDVKKMFRAIMYNKTLNNEEKNHQLKKLAEKVLSQKQLREFEWYMEDRMHKRKEFEDKLNNLSPAAKETYEKLERLKAERAKIIDNLDEEVRKELRNLYRRKNRRIRAIAVNDHDTYQS